MIKYRKAPRCGNSYEASKERQRRAQQCNSSIDQYRFFQISKQPNSGHSWTFAGWMNVGRGRGENTNADTAGLMLGKLEISGPHAYYCGSLPAKIQGVMRHVIRAITRHAAIPGT